MPVGSGSPSLIEVHAVVECFWICNKLVIVIFRSCSFQNRFALLKNNKIMSSWFLSRIVIVSVTSWEVFENLVAVIFENFWLHNINWFSKCLDAWRVLWNTNDHCQGYDYTGMLQATGIPWRCRTKSSLSPRDPRSVFGCKERLARCATTYTVYCIVMEIIK